LVQDNLNLLFKNQRQRKWEEGKEDVVVEDEDRENKEGKIKKKDDDNQIGTVRHGRFMQIPSLSWEKLVSLSLTLSPLFSFCYFVPPNGKLMLSISRKKMLIFSLTPADQPLQNFEFWSCHAFNVGQKLTFVIQITLTFLFHLALSNYFSLVHSPSYWYEVNVVIFIWKNVFLV